MYVITPDDILDQLRHLERDLRWLAYEIDVPVETLGTWIYGRTPIPRHRLLEIDRVLKCEHESIPGRSADDEMVLVIRIPADKVPILEQAARLKAKDRGQTISMENYIIGTAVDTAAFDLDVIDDGSAWDYEQ